MRLEKSLTTSAFALAVRHREPSQRIAFMYELTGQFVGSGQAGGGPQLWLAFPHHQHDHEHNGSAEHAACNGNRHTREVNYAQMQPDARLEKDKWRRIAPKVGKRRKNQELPCQLRYTRLLSGG